MLLLVKSRFADDLESLTQNKILKIVEDFKIVYIEYKDQVLQSSEKLLFYRQTSNSFYPQNYLDVLRTQPSEKNYVKIIIGSHNLHIETGRYCKSKHRACLQILL